MDIISLKEAQDFNFNLPLPHLEVVRKNIYEVLGDILAFDIFCSRPLPAFDHSAMDGYALKISDLDKKLKLKGRILAGEDTEGLEVSDGECIKIMTGGKIPKGADVVVPFEDSMVLQDCFIQIQKHFKHNENIRFQGEERALGSVIAKRGDKLTHGLIALIASQGIAEIEVYEKLKIAVYSTGDEVVEPGEKASQHQVYNINAVGIISLLSVYGHHSKYLGILNDSTQELHKAILNFEEYDVVITSGGASVGEADLLEKSLLSYGAKISYHKINLKPGRPIMLATLGKSIIFALPGNPLSGMVNLHSIVLSALERLRGANAYYPKPIIAKLKSPLHVKNGRVNMILGKYAEGIFEAYDGGKYSSNAISIVSQCNSVALIGEKISVVTGDIKILPYVMEFSDKISEFINE
ncbi:molybdopterin molybdotransferase MoeA [Helicobacter sp. 11S03491-1]|uniref:molybdopterin molybdotransferase MoeA n=1 Tax=Helicobacter sp. 11S03491-1 TaxID=1476196 RepID=UPI000BA72C5B|nr:molybdopterin molybdotransferase MoeA [Helicobacter sp. 11S03491-1]PAF41178.1 hypothetical protein BKH45_08100 [Helicobacter sp. 11S03491-1]